MHKLQVLLDGLFLDISSSRSATAGLLLLAGAADNQKQPILGWTAQPNQQSEFNSLKLKRLSFRANY